MAKEKGPKITEVNGIEKEHRKKLGDDTIQEGLEGWLTIILSKTSKASRLARSIFKIEACTISPHKARSLKIPRVSHNKEHRKILFKIQLAGHEEIWLVSMSLPQALQPLEVAGEFRKEIKKVTDTVCREEADRLAEKKDDQPPSSDPKDDKQDTKGDDKTPKTSGRIKTANIVTDKVIDILRVWEQRSSGLKKISQREFMGHLDEAGLAPNTNKTLVVNFLVRKGIITKTTPAPRQPVVQLTDQAITLLKEDDEKRKKDEEERERNLLTEKAFAFPQKVSFALEALQLLTNLQREVKEIELEESETSKLISDLKSKLWKLEKDKKDCLEKIAKITRSIESSEITALIDTAKNIVSELDSQSN